MEVQGSPPNQEDRTAAATTAEWEHRSLEDVHAVLIVASRKWNLQTTADSKHEAVVEIYQWMQGTGKFNDNQDPTSADYLRPVFPPLSVVSDHAYEDGCLVGIIEKTYPGDAFISSISEAWPNKVGLAYVVLVGDIDADGSVTISDRKSGSRVDVRLHKKSDLADDPYKSFLRTIGFNPNTRDCRISNDKIHGTLLLPVALQSSVLKRSSWESVSALFSSDTHFKGSTTSLQLTVPAKQLRSLASSRTSTSNHAHGVLETEEHFKNLFQQVIDGAGNEMAGKKVFLAYAAGFYSGDGCIRDVRVELAQSNKNFLNALAFFLHKICGVSLIQARVKRKAGQSGIQLRKFVLEYTLAEDVSKLCRTVGLYDFGRRVQWLLALLASDIRLMPGRKKYAKHNDVDRLEIKFIQAVLSYAKKVLES